MFDELFIDHVNFVDNKCDVEHSLSILAGKILHGSYGKVEILCPNFHIKPRVMKVKAEQVLRCAPLSSYQKLIGMRQCNLHKM